MTAAAPQLEYAPGAPVQRRRRLRRVMVMLLLASFGLAVWWFHAPLWHQAKLLYYERQCLNYTASPEQVVYDEDNDAVSPLIGTPGYRALPNASSFRQRSRIVGPAGVAVRPAPQWENYVAALGWSTPIPGATVFLHERRTKSGLVRLVVVTRTPVETRSDFHDYGLEPLVIAPAGLKSQPIVQTKIVGGWSTIEPPNPADTQNLRFYAGQCDPADSAHFTIKYDLCNGSGIIDGRLNEDGETVTLKIVSGPAPGTKWVIDGVSR